MRKTVTGPTHDAGNARRRIVRGISVYYYRIKGKPGGNHRGRRSREGPRELFGLLRDAIPLKAEGLTALCHR